MIPDVQLASMSSCSEGIHFIRTERKDFLPPDPVPPPIGYNQGYLPTEYSLNTSPFRRKQSASNNDNPVFQNRAYATLDTRKSPSQAKLLCKVPSSGSFELESNVAGAQGSVHGDLTSRLHQARDSASLLQEHLQSLEKMRRQTSMQNLEGQESCV